jgi:O-methyltransferase involved in polyketide biosynthesis
MSSGETRVEHVSDTALITAVGRAIETARADGIVRDPFAEKLAGARGAALAHVLASQEWMGIAVGLRCRVIDEMLTEAIATYDIRVVAILGAGLDTRPWRLDLPPELRWIEVDFPGILDYKAQLLASEKPKCRLERIAADLTDATERRAVFAAAGNQPGLILTEGLLLYLPASTTGALATEPVRLSGIRYWLLDIAASVLTRNAHWNELGDIEKVRAKDRVEGQGILDLVQRNGWNFTARRKYANEGFQIAAARGLKATQESAGQVSEDDPSGIYLFSRTELPTPVPPPVWDRSR